MSKNAQVMNAIQQDIRRRGLRSGDPYQSAREVAQLLDVSPMTADRAMRRLAGKGVLCRKHGAGTFVGEAVDELLIPELRNVQIIIPTTFFSVYRGIVENIVVTLHREFPTDSIEHLFVPESGQIEFCTRIIKRWAAGNEPRTVVLVSCSQQIQRLFSDVGVPVVATGGIAKGHCTLPWIDMDHREAGRQLAAYARTLGHRRFLVLMNHLWGCGDNEFLEGIEAGITEDGDRGVDARVRSVEWDAVAIETVLAQALRSDSPPTGVFCTTRFTAELAVKLGEKLNKSVPDEFFVGTVLVRTPSGPAPKYAYTRWGTTRESNDALYQMVHQMNEGRPADPNHFLIPVEIVIPDEVVCWT